MLYFTKGDFLMTEIPAAPIDRIIRKAGADRVSEEAAQELAKILEEIALGIASQANTFAQHAGRKTITAQDIQLASKMRK